ncbi:SdrD B-like domain-containing protein [Candidatus Halobeggiatoa sp. HSG11]|nr:SdrD B-like domain-containing protein [Candidatus Halobeggiatoa sp. HSG11]
MKNLFFQRGSVFSYTLSVMGIVMMLGISTNAHARAELALEQSVEGDVTSVLSGQPFTFLLKYRCASTTENCENVQLTSTLPAEITEILQEVSPAGAAHQHIEAVDITENVVTWQFISPLEAGSTGELTMSVVLKNGQTPNNTIVTNSATISSDNADSVENVISTVTVTAESVITLTKALNSINPRLDFDTKYRVTMCNQDGYGQLDLNNVTMVDQLPANTNYISSGRNGVYDATGETITWPTKDLKVGECFTYYDFTVQYPSSIFSEGDITNVVTATGTVVGVAEPQVYTAQVTNYFGPGMGEGVANFSVVKQGPNTIIQGGTFDYGFTIKNTGSVTLDEMIITDTIPLQMDVTNIRAGDNNQIDGSVPVSIDYKTNTNSTWTTVAGSPFNTPPMQLVDVASLNLSDGEYITDLKWTYPSVPVGFRSDVSRNVSTGFSVTVLSEDRNGQPVNVGDILENTVLGETSYEGRPKNAIHTKKTEVINAMAKPVIIKTVSGMSTITPGDTVTYEITLINKSETLLVNPSIVDILDDNLEYESWSPVSGGTKGIPSPTFSEKTNQEGKTVLYWEWLGDNAHSFKKWNRYKINMTARVKSTTLPGLLGNRAYSIAENPNTAINLNSCIDKIADTSDIDGDGDVEELLCSSDNALITASKIAAMESLKWVRGQLDYEYHRYPNWGKTARGGTLDYRLIVKNVGNVSMTNVVVVDILPFISDTGVIDLSQRESNWQPRLRDVVNAGNGIIVSYSVEENPCRSEVLPTNPVDCQEPQWSTNLPDDIAAVRSLRFDFGEKVFDPGDELKLEWPMLAPIDAALGTEEEPSIAWNSFGYVATRVDNGDTLLPSEPIKVGIEVVDFEPAVLGDRVWLDYNANGLQDNDEVGLNGVKVEVYKPGADGIPNTADDEFLEFTRTADGPDGEPGFYIFSFLDGGDYFVKFYPPVGYAVSPQDASDDDLADSDVNPDTNSTIIITLESETLDYSWDMGLVEKGTAALGDYVWFDRDQNGQQNESKDLGISGVEVTLYRDDGNGIADPASDQEVEITNTASDGSYLFEDLGPGDYFVKFTLPEDAEYFTGKDEGSSDAEDSDVDSDGVTDIVTLGKNEFNRTVDAGIFVIIGDLSLGNQVWLDKDEELNGTYSVADGDEGINGVKVNLYRDTDGNNEYTPNVDQQISSMVTFTKGGTPGYYLFEELKPGDYIVQIDPDNFAVGGPLNDPTTSFAFITSEGSGPNSSGSDPDDGIDNDSNGNPVVGHGVVSSAVTLVAPEDPEDEAAKVNLTVDFGFNPRLDDVIPGCSEPNFYALNDKLLNDTGIFGITPNTGVATALGDVLSGYDLEGLDTDPITDILYASSGDDVNGDIENTVYPTGTLYQIDKSTGVATPVNPEVQIWPGEVSAISFKNNGELWAWSDRKAGPLVVDLLTGIGERANTSSEADYSQFAIEGMTWNNEDDVLYLAENSNRTGKSSAESSTLYSWDSSTGETIICPVSGQIEALDMANNNVLLFAVHEDGDFNIYGWRTTEGGCPVLPGEATSENPSNIVLKYNTEIYSDIEAISWPNSCDVEAIISQQGLEE